MENREHEPGLEWGSSRLAFDRRPIPDSPLGKLGHSGYIKVIPPGYIDRTPEAPVTPEEEAAQADLDTRPD